MKDIYLTNFYYYLNQELVAFSGKDYVGDTVGTWTDGLCCCSIKCNHIHYICKQTDGEVSQEKSRKQAIISQRLR